MKQPSKKKIIGIREDFNTYLEKSGDGALSDLFTILVETVCKNDAICRSEPMFDVFAKIGSLLNRDEMDIEQLESMANMAFNVAEIE